MAFEESVGLEDDWGEYEDKPAPKVDIIEIRVLKLATGKIIKSFNRAALKNGSISISSWKEGDVLKIIGGSAGSADDAYFYTPSSDKLLHESL